jgi:acyl-CoA synthetase (AMP-forming)/AMP-acid ligase II
MPHDSTTARLLALGADDPERVAIHLLRSDAKGVLVDEPLTMGEWVRGAAAIAAALSGKVRRGERVLLCVPTGRAFLEAFLGALSIGAVPVPLPSLEGFARPAAFVNRLSSVVQDAAPSAVFADQRTAAHLRQCGLLSADLPLIEPGTFEPTATPQFCPAVDDETAFIQYTSGSTGTPRGVVITARNLAANVNAMGEALRLTAEDRVVSWLPLYHDMGLIGGLLAPAAHGASCWLMSPLEFMLRPSRWLHALSKARATLTVAPNFAYGMVARKVADKDLLGLDLSSLRAAINGAEPVDPATAEAFCKRLAPAGFSPSSYLPVYGLAEATLSVTFPPLSRGIKVDHVRRDDLSRGQAVVAEPGAADALRLVSVGRPIAGHDVEIVGDDHAPLPERRLGEIVVRGPSVSPRYFDQHRPHGERRRSLRTGDVGYLADGELYVVDRLKDLVIVAGRCYSPSDIERAAERVPGVRSGRAVAFGVTDGERGTEALVLAVEVRPRSGKELDRLAEAVRTMVAEQIGLAAADVRLLRPSVLARTSSGKLMRRDARDRYLARTLDDIRTAQPTPTPAPASALGFAHAAKRAVIRLISRRRDS